MNRHTKTIGLVGTACVLAGVVGLVLRDQPASSAVQDQQVQLATVERRDLADTQTAAGQIGYADSLSITAAGLGTLTGLPRDGSVVKRGGTLYRVDDVPVSLLIGRLPLWRDLSYGVSDGRDVRELERNLKALGYDPGTVDDDFTSYTREAIEDFQEDRGLEENGTVTRDRFVVQPTSLRVGGAQALLGAQLQPGTVLYGATSTAKVITVKLGSSDGQLARVGDKAGVTLPNGGTIKATITEVGSPVADSGSGDDASPTDARIPVTLTPDSGRKLRGLDSAPATVEFTRAVHKDVLAVPVTALVALSEGGFALKLEGGQLVAVTTGLYAGGYVEITQGLTEGQQVEVPE